MNKKSIRLRYALTAGLLLGCFSVSNFIFAADAVWEIHGVDPKTQINIQKRLSASRSALGKNVTPAEITRFLNEAQTDAELAMQPFGYFHPQIKTTYKKKRGDYVLKLQITPGPRTLLRQVTVKLTGEGAAANTDLIKEFGILPHSPLSIPNYQEAKALLFNHLQARGYVKASITENKILIDKKSNTADMTVIMDTGDRYYFGLVTFSPNPMDPKLLARYIPFHVGDPYSSSALLKMQDNLLLSRYFQTVVVEPDMSVIKNHQIPLYVKLEPRKAKLYLAGIGYSTDIGPRGTLGIDWRRVNRFGHRMQAIIKGSNRYYDIQAQYSIPGLKPLTDVFTISTSLFHHHVGQVNSKGYNAALSYTELWHGWQKTMSLKYLREISYQNDLLNHNTTWLYPELILKKIRSNNDINTDNGFRLLFSTQAATRKIIASDDFWQIHADAKYIHTFKTNTRFLIHGESGATWVNDINRIAPSLQFYAGGSQSIRGFDYLALGPGRYLLQAGVELQQPIYNKWSGAVFYDAGNAFDNPREFHFQKSIGVGLVRRTPIGSINLGIAKPLGHEYHGYNLVLSFGPDL